MKILKNQSIESDRLRLLPLTAEALAAALENYDKIQMDLGLNITEATLDEELKYAMKVRLKKVLEDVKNYMWLTNWAIVNKEQNKIVGFIMIKGLPNENGEVIVGYGIDDGYRRNGFASEALKRLKEWIFENPKATFVIADTEKTNIASHKVLINVGAVKYKETDELVWWKISR